MASPARTFSFLFSPDRRSIAPITPHREHAAMNDYVLNKKPEVASNNDTVWAFDLGKGSIGEAVRRGNEFLHKASLLIPAELGQRGPASMSGTPASRYRMLQTRRAHQRREDWLDAVWEAAGLRSEEH